MQLKISKWFCTLFLITLIEGCVYSTEGIATTSLTTQISPFRSISPTEKTPFYFTSSVINTPIPTYTLSVIPTLPAKEAQNKLLELLATNSNCRLPCLWGIIPGKSFNQEARNILMPLSGISTNTYLDPSKLLNVLLGTTSPQFVEGNQRLNIWIAYIYNENGIVNSIGFKALEEQLTTDSNGNWISKQPIFDSPVFYKRVDYYSLHHVLSEQGMPTSVMLHASGLSGYPVVAGGIEIALLYPDQGIWVNYTMPMYNLNGIKKGCPASSHIEMELFPPGNPDNFLTQLDKTDWFYTKSGYRPLEEATSLSVKEFYETFRNPTDKCVETPANLWPPPEPGGG